MEGTDMRGCLRILATTVFLTAVSVVTVPAIAEDASTEHARAACSQKFGIQGTCKISMWSVVGSPGAYEGQTLHMIAYLAMDNRLPVIYPSREAFLLHDAMASIEIFGPYEELRVAMNKWGYRYVRVSGIFHLGDGREAGGPRLGILESAKIHTPVHLQSEDRENLDPVIRAEQLHELEEQKNGSQKN
jgi:hypothetical protein